MKIREKRILLFAKAVIFIFSACAHDEHISPEIPTEQFIRIYVEAVKAPLDSTQADTADFLKLTLEKHDVTLEEWEQTVEHYQKDPAIWFDIFSEIQEHFHDSTAVDTSKKRRLFQ